MKTGHSLTFLAYFFVLVLLVTSCSTALSLSSSVKPSTSSTAEALTVTTSTTTAAALAKPQGELVAALSSFGSENFLPWKSDNGASQICGIVYDVLLYWDEVNRKFLPGLGESWEISQDALTLTYHLRKGVQFHENWGELTSADIKYNFEKQAGKDSVGKTAASRNIKSMDTPDPYTLIVHLIKPAPTFFSEFSLGNGGTCQGIVCKKYVETVGDEVSSQKPIGTGPYKLVESQVASYYKFEAVDNHWRVVPEFKSLTVRLVPEISTTIAMLKNKEIDLAAVPSEQLADLKAAGVATEVSSVGGNIFEICWGGIAIPQDSRYNAAYHNKDPWTDVRVRKAMAISIDRQAIVNAIFAGGATPISVPLFAAGMEKYQYPYDPAAAKQLLADAGYPNGFSFNVMSHALNGIPEAPRILEALTGYWQQIGLNPKITVIEYAAFIQKNRNYMKTAGSVFPFGSSPGADMLDKASIFLMPNGGAVLYQDEESYTIWKEGITKVYPDERAAYVDKLNQHYYENFGPIPVANIGFNFAWNSTKISPWPHAANNTPYYLEYVRHAQPLNTFRLVSPWPDR